MDLAIERLEITGALLIRPTVFRDARGFFLESWSAPRFREAGVDVAFVQDNHSRSVGGTIRGLHFQAFGAAGPEQVKLVRVARGRIWDVIVDLRPGSPTLGRWCAVELDEAAHAELLVPAGCAHGFAVLSEVADVLYKQSTPYAASTERGVAWDDADLAISWPVMSPVLSDRDRGNPSFADYLAGRS